MQSTGFGITVNPTWWLYQSASWPAPSLPSKNLSPAAACQLAAMRRVRFPHFYPIKPWNVTVGSHQLALRSTLSHPLQGPRQPEVVQLFIFFYAYLNITMQTSSRWPPPSSSGNWCQVLGSQHTPCVCTRESTWMPCQVFSTVWGM